MDVIDLSEDVSDGISGMGSGGTINLVDSMGPTGFASRRKRKRRAGKAVLQNMGNGGASTSEFLSDNAKVHDLSARVKRLREDLRIAEEQLSVAVDKKLASATTAGLGADGTLSLENGSVLDKLKETLQCSICLDSYTTTKNIHSTACGHLFHKRCLERCIKAGHKKCPLCKKGLNNLKQLHPIWI